ncbi:MAG TPA: ATP-binding protein [Phycisphaerae bacterium]|nr:ATP-binding protein [Phycisphaerae bacterium]
MIPSGVILVIDAVGTAVFLVALVLALFGRGSFRGPAWALLVAILGLSIVDGSTNLLEWSGILPEADVAEDFFEPLLPIFWLFLFVVALERSGRDRLHRGYERMGAVHDLTLRLTVSMEPQAIMDQVVDAAARLLALPGVAISTVEPDGQTLAVRACRGFSARDAEVLRPRIGEGLTGRAFAHRVAYQTANPAEDLAPAALPVAEQQHITDVVAVPLVFQGSAVGVLTASRSGHHAFSGEEVRLLETLSAHAAVAIENARLYERVVESEAKYRVLVENTQTAIVVVDAYRTVIFWNRGAERLYGWTADEVLGHHIEFIYPEDRRADVVQTVLPALQREGSWSGEYPAIRKDGSRFTSFLNLSRIFDAQSNVICTLGILTDVTELVHLREQLFQAQKMETVGTLAGGIAHDFNNLLTAILGATGLLADSLRKGPVDHESLASIEQAAARGTQLVRQLMTFSQRQPTRQEPIDLNDIVREAAELIQRTFPKDMTLTTNLAPDLHITQGDSTQMHQVIMNLAVNARDAMPRAGALTIATENIDLADGPQAGPGVVLTVTDTGHGISAEQRPHIFEPFFTTKTDGRGTGLGLSTVYAIVTRHGGRITFTSEVGKGTSFRIVLPANR